ncbi:hypothetical protein BDR26DRAFT_854141 [Obelidium mucronatum]|nr:hypothetical protein BDR26DRAFT_854141 [Obelidium mucronatum]
MGDREYFDDVDAARAVAMPDLGCATSDDSEATESDCNIRQVYRKRLRTSEPSLSVAAKYSACEGIEGQGCQTTSGTDGNHLSNESHSSTSSVNYEHKCTIPSVVYFTPPSTRMRVNQSVTLPPLSSFLPVSPPFTEIRTQEYQPNYPNVVIPVSRGFGGGLEALVSVLEHDLEQRQETPLSTQEGINKSLENDTTRLSLSQPALPTNHQSPQLIYPILIRPPAPSHVTLSTMNGPASSLRSDSMQIYPHGDQHELSGVISRSSTAGPSHTQKPLQPKIPTHATLDLDEHAAIRKGKKPRINSKNESPIDIDQKRIYRQQVEQKRRDLLKQSFDALKALVPTKRKSPPKDELLNEATSYILQLQMACDEKMRMIEEMEAELVKIRSAL